MQADATTDFLIIGAGFSGLVVAERLAAAGWRCVVVDRRNHMGGNAHDGYDAAGVLVHHYGPHYFRTQSQKVIDYLSRFTAWHPVDYTIKSFTHGRYWSFPINLRTFEQYLGRASNPEEFSAWLDSQRVPIAEPKNSEEVILSRVGPEWYRQFFEGYTRKQWQCDPRELDPSVCARIPMRTDRNERYLNERFQALPARGYHVMFENMLAAAPQVECHLGMDLLEARARWRCRHLIYTGAIDAYFDYRFGPLPYRSLRFEAESFSPEQLVERMPIAGKPGFWQPAVQVNYPDAEVPFTRIVEMKHATGQAIDASTIIREFPKSWTPDDEPYYPMPTAHARDAYQKYAALAAAESNCSFIGRLACYQYYNMDQVTALAMAEADHLLARYGSP